MSNRKLAERLVEGVTPRLNEGIQLPWMKPHVSGLDTGYVDISYRLSGLESLLVHAKLDGEEPPYANIDKSLLTKFMLPTVNFDNLTIRDQRKTIEQMIKYLKKALAEEKAKTRDSRRADRDYDRQSAGMAALSKASVTYTGDKDERILPAVIRSLKLGSHIKPRSVIEVSARFRREKDPESTNQYTFTNYFASGYITIDGKEYPFEDVQFHQSGYDHFPPG